MKTKRSVTLWLDSEDYEQLAAEARRVGTSPDALAQTYLHANIARANETDAEQRRRGIDALHRLTVLREELRRDGYASVDAVQLIREGRDELSRRSLI